MSNPGLKKVFGMWTVQWERREAACGAVRRGVGGLRGSLRGVRCLTPPLRSGRAVIITPKEIRYAIRRVFVCIGLKAPVFAAA